MELVVRVLVCDDEPDIRLLYREPFELEGAEVDEANDGDEAVGMARAPAPISWCSIS
ncbi:MAG: hypothetical protein ACRD0U_15370 [Acidimicrobiales bacterium]